MVLIKGLVCPTWDACRVTPSLEVVCDIGYTVLMPDIDRNDDSGLPGHYRDARADYQDALNDGDPSSDEPALDAFIEHAMNVDAVDPIPDPVNAENEHGELDGRHG